MPDGDGFTGYGPWVNVSFTPQTSLDSSGNIHQSASIPDAIDPHKLHRSIDITTSTNFHDNPTTVMTFHQKLLSSDSKDFKGFTGLKVAVMTDFVTLVWRIDQILQGDDFKCDLTIYARSNLHSVGIAMDEVGNIEGCPMATPSDLQNVKWDNAVTGDLSTPTYINKGTPTEKIESGGEIALSKKSLKYATASYLSEGFSSIEIIKDPTETNDNKPMTRTLVTMTLNNGIGSKVQYVLPAGPNKQYKCYGIYAQKETLLQSITFQSEEF